MTDPRAHPLPPIWKKEGYSIEDIALMAGGTIALNQFGGVSLPFSAGVAFGAHWIWKSMTSHPKNNVVGGGNDKPAGSSHDGSIPVSSSGLFGSDEHHKYAIM